ncbi:MAG: CSLREA domain-containing protein, partial [Methylococcales bacterium]|nr:CSLREA domain-containing protein [Methylococcales bacterium]
GKDGIAVIDSSSIENAFTNNLIYANDELGIDLADDGVTANDADDSDSGANTLQNYPTLTAGSLSTMLVELTSTASTTYTIHMFTSNSCDPSGYGEGEVWQDKFSFTTSGSGTISQTFTFSNTLAGQYATATAIDAAGNTSEFSACTKITDEIVVNSADDANDSSCDVLHCSLREAILAVNSGLGNTIEFAIAGTGPHTIQPTTPLPVMAQPVTIDGTSQAGASCATSSSPTNLMIELDGSMAGSSNGLDIKGGSSVVQGLAVYNFEIRGIFLRDNGSNTVRCNHLGTDGSGTTDGLDNNSDSITVSRFDNNQIGGSVVADRNVIVNSFDPSGASSMGIRLSNGENNTVTGNYIGVDASGVVAMGHESAGIRLEDGTVSTTNNVIGGNSWHGIHIVGGGTATVHSNNIGVGSDDSTAVGNGKDGIHIWNSSNSVIGVDSFVTRGAAVG